MKTGIFVTGTSTNIGKTFISALLMRAAIRQGLAVRYFKPVQTGEDSDCDTIKLLANADESAIIRPVYKFKAPETPYLAAKMENATIYPEKFKKAWEALAPGHYIVEGAGGLMVPTAENYLMLDLITTLNLPILVVAATKLGTMNHTLLTLKVAQMAGIAVKGLVFSGEPHAELVETISMFTDVPTLAQIPKVDNIIDHIDALSDNFFPPACLKEILK